MLGLLQNKQMAESRGGCWDLGVGMLN